jgi:protein-disulfide isomerase
MHDLIFQNQDRWATQVNRRPASFMEGLARQAGLDMDAYGSCMETQKFAPQIQANYQSAAQRGIPSTPTFIIGGKQINGSISYDELKRYVDEAVAAVRATQSKQ